MPAAEMSDEKKERLGELQGKYVQAKRQLLQVQGQLQMNDRDKKRSELTISELATLAPGTNTYKSVGKCFLYKPLDTLKDEINSTIKECTTETEALLTSKTTMEQICVDSEKEMREIIGKPADATAAAAATEASA